MKSKKGAEFAIGTIVVIVLALIVLVLLALGFTSGWGNLWNRVTDIFSSANVDSVRQGCSVACSTGATYDYCQLPRDVIYKDPTTGKLSKEYTSNGDPVKGKQGSKTCVQLESISPFNFEHCTQVTCPATETCQIKTDADAVCGAVKADTNNACTNLMGCKWETKSATVTTDDVCVADASKCSGLQGAACKDECELK